MNLSIKNVPEEIVCSLRKRAERNHRSLQGELSAIIEAAAREAQPKGVSEVWAEIQKRGLRSPSDSVSIVRADRDRDESR